DADDPNPRHLMGGLSSQGTGRWETVIEQSKKRIAEEPDVVCGYSALQDAYFFLGRFDDAEKLFQQASTRKLEEQNYVVYRYNIAFLKGEKEQMDRAVAQAKGRRITERLVANSEALVSARSGQLQQARQLSSRAVNLARQEGNSEAA